MDSGCQHSCLHNLPCSSLKIDSHIPHRAFSCSAISLSPPNRTEPHHQLEMGRGLEGERWAHSFSVSFPHPS